MKEQELVSRQELAQNHKTAKVIRKIKKNHKLYFRDSRGTLRRLDNVSQEIYGLIIVDFLKGDAEKRYADLNGQTKHWSELVPLRMEIGSKYSKDWDNLISAIKSVTETSSVVISYNGSWKPLVRLTLGEPNPSDLLKS